MKTLKAIIVDDEVKLQQVFKHKLEEYCPSIQVVATAINVNTAYDAIQAHRPDIVFLDIQMPNETGFELLERFEETHFEVIFVTGFNNYLLDALQVSAADYILKPVCTKKLIEAVARAKERIHHKERVAFYQNLVHNTKNLGDQATKLAIPSADSYEFVQISDIIRCEGWDKYTRIYFKDGSEIVSSYYIGIFKDMLTSYGFYSTHRSHLINIQYITRYLKEGTVIMSDTSQVPVSRRKRDDFALKVLNDFALRGSKV